MVPPPLTDLFDLEGHEAVVDVDLAAELHHIGDVLVVQPQGLVITVLLEGVVQGQLDHVTLLQLHLRLAALGTGERDGMWKRGMDVEERG